MAVSAYLYNGHWKRIEVVATKSNAGDTLGLDALPVRKSFGLSWAEIAKKMFCYSGKLECGLSDTKFGKLVGDKEGYNYGRIKAPPAEFIFATIQGDTLHGAAPVFYCEKDCAKPKKLKEVMDAQIGFALQDNFLLVATEYDAGNPKVYDTTNGKLIYENVHATKTIWFPGE